MTDKTKDERKPNQGGKTIFIGRTERASRIPNLSTSDKAVKTLAEKESIKLPTDDKIPPGEPPPKLEQKSYEEITAQSVVTLPHNQVRPVNGRIFCKEVNPEEMKTDGGIILPSQYDKPEAKGGQQIQLKRYFVIDVADDCTIRFKKRENTTPCKIKRGDEVFPFIPDVVDFKFPTLFDFYINKEYMVFHETELGGVGVSSLIQKEK